MGGWDFDCALCGASFFTFEPLPEAYPQEDFKWIEKIRFIGFNPDSLNVNKYFITGVGNGVNQEYGSVDCPIGDDENVPRGERAQGPRLPTEIRYFTTYSFPDEEFAAPFHPPCFQVFAQALRYLRSGRVAGIAESEEVSKELLYEAMKRSYGGNYEPHLELDYGELGDVNSEQYWDNVPGYEAWSTNPLQSPAISKYMATLSAKAPITVHPTASKPHSKHYGPFSNLAEELVCEILLCLPYTDLQSLVRSGMIPLNLPTIRSFWKRKLFLDMPWLWDFPPTDQPRDWFSTYQELRRQCFASTPERDPSGQTVLGDRDGSLVLGLANRRRVWMACEQLAKVYLGQKMCVDVDGSAEIGEGVSLQMPLVADKSKDGQSLHTQFLSSWGDLEKEVRFWFFFKEDGERLCGIEMTFVKTGEKKMFGVRAREGVEVAVPGGTWIDGVEFNICDADNLTDHAKLGISGLKIYLQNGKDIQVKESNGAKRQMMAAKDMTITGLMGSLAEPDGIIQRIGLLQSHRSPDASQSPPTLSTLPKLLWHTSIPPPPLTATPYETGYWSPVRSFDLLPQHHLVFGTTPAALAFLTGISGDEQMLKLAAHYADGSEQSIGCKSVAQMSRFDIDGPGGERVVRVEVGMNALPQAIKITTNRNRFAFFGKTQKNMHMVYEPCVQKDGEERFIAGIYASFGYRGGLCTSISILSAPAKEQGERGDVEVQGVRDGTVFNPPLPEGEHMSRMLGRPQYLALVDDDDVIAADGKYW